MALKNWWKWLTRKSRPAHRPAPRRAFRPTLEALEERAVPTVLFPSALGGDSIFWGPGNGAGQPAYQPVTSPITSNPTVLNNPEVYLIFWGQSWMNATAQRFANDARAIIQSQYLSRLRDYGSDGLARFGGFTIDNSAAASLGAGAATQEIQNELDGHHADGTSDPNTNSWARPTQPASPAGSLFWPGAVGAPVYVVVFDNGGAEGHNGPDDYTPPTSHTALAMNHIWMGGNAGEAAFTEILSHKLVERISSGGGGIAMNAQVNAGTDGEWQGAQIADNEPDGPYEYPLNGTLWVQAYWSISAHAFIVPDGNSETIVLSPHWNLSDPHNPHFLCTFDLTVPSDPSGSTITLAVSQSGPTTGELQVTDNGQVFWLPTSQLSSVTVAGAASDTIHVVNESIPLNITDSGQVTLDVDAGTLSVPHASSIPAQTHLVIAAGATFDSNGYDVAVANLAGSGTVVVVADTLIVGGDNSNSTFNGTISGAGGVGGLRQVGTGTLYLGGNNSYQGYTEVVAGTLAIGSLHAVGPNSIVQVDLGATLETDTFQAVIGGLQGSGTVVLAAYTALHVGGSVISGTIFSGTFLGAGSLTKEGTGSLILTGTDHDIGPISVEAGILSVGNGYAVSFANPDEVFVDRGGTFALNGFNVRVGGLDGSGTVTLGSGTLTTGSLNQNDAFSGVISGSGGLTKVGSGTLTLSGNNTYSGQTEISAGTLRLGSPSAGSPNSTVLVDAGAALDVASLATIGSLSGAGNVLLNSFLITGANNSNSVFSGRISGTSALEKAGTGTLTLSGTNTYSGIEMNNGILRVGSAGALPGLARASVDPLGTLDLNGFAVAVGALSGNASGRVLLGSGTLTEGSANSNDTFSGVISGSGGLTKVGSGTLTLSGNNTFTGTTHVTGGTLVVTGGLGGVNLDAGTTLAGTGTVGQITGAGTVSPGTAGTTGELFCVSPILTSSTLQVRLNGLNPGSGYDQLDFVGRAELGGTTALHVSAGFTSPVGTVFTIVQGQNRPILGPGIVDGTFAGLPDGALFSASGQLFRINYTVSGSSILTLTHVVAPTATTLTSSGASVYGQSVTLTAAVTAQGGVSPAGGTVTFYDGATVLGNAVVDANGNAALTTAALSAGSHSLTAVFAATGALGSSTSAALAQAVSPAPLTITADDQAKVAGGPLPTLTAHYSGFVLGQTPAVLATPVTLATYSGDTAGSYAIVASGATAANYTITFANGILTVSPAAASTFVVSGFPSQVTADDSTDVVTVTAHDAYGNVATGYAGTVHFSSSDAQAALPADTTLTNGTGSFSVTLFTAGGQTLTATDTASGGLSGSATVTVAPAAADHLVFLQPPTDTPAGQTLSPVLVAIVDQFGNVEAGDSSDAVTLSLGVDPSGGTATLSGTLTVTVVNGMATFSDLAIDQAGAGYTLHATIGGGVPDLDSNPFTII
jgi:autotransporter-associated beta strand protein